MARSLIPDLLPGTLDLLILRTLQTDSLHGWAISERIQQISQDVLQINQGSLYPALHRLEMRGEVKSEMTASENNRRARVYTITRAGRKSDDGRSTTSSRRPDAVSWRLRPASGSVWLRRSAA
jgi:PadR family transcriptional regulator PadR